MDEVLNSNPAKFRMLRANQKVSFLKVDDEEDKALFDIILINNEEELTLGKNVFNFEKREHERIQKRLEQVHRLQTYQLLLDATNENRIKHEMVIEAALCELLGKEANQTPFGTWDYISHQVVASPFKPIHYMDKMDIFGYRYIKGYDTISKYLVIEIKKDDADDDVVNQVMKYVDWIQQEYAHGDYSMIEAYIVAADFPDGVVEKMKKECVRQFTKGCRPVVSGRWEACKLVRYFYDGVQLKFDEYEG